MTINRPGLPGDLPPAEVLWARWALVAVLEATTAAERVGRHRTGTWVDDQGLHLDDSGSTWWGFARRGEGRYVLFGEDESSGVKWHNPPVDMLAGAPDWLPHERLRDLLGGDELGCVYWYENGIWARAPYPASLDDDGLDCGMSRFVDRKDVLRTVADEDHGAMTTHDAETLLGRAEAHRLPSALLLSLLSGPDGLDGREPDRPAMTRALELAGLDRA
ncbi:hypothetical protein [Streptomyces griseiscabiei]|uniref:Uncharacterized protein n=1 Tax=Streptomyces griseiscabiei TaxID=2993540 RepID=A0ABU4L1S2_9ACTN|nr:hypothetical protein [Streptomyces griseiscabiei]MBZ3906012.1 hypothetical protein [Streptomyces griseiscabiei]MDX2909643.1 hypothetical protein [Streptomyces griseiscabiei]